MGTGVCVQVTNLETQVSIQLMSPASGDVDQVPYVRHNPQYLVSIQLMSPASGDYSQFCYERLNAQGVSIQLMSPASGD